MIRKINTLVVSWHEEEDNHLIEDKGNGKAQKADIRQNYKRHIPQTSLLLWHKMVAIRCFFLPLALQLWLGWQAGRQNFELW